MWVSGGHSLPPPPRAVLLEWLRASYSAGVLVRSLPGCPALRCCFCPFPHPSPLPPPLPRLSAGGRKEARRAASPFLLCSGSVSPSQWLIEGDSSAMASHTAAVRRTCCCFNVRIATMALAVYHVVSVGTAPRMPPSPSRSLPGLPSCSVPWGQGSLSRVTRLTFSPGLSSCLCKMGQQAVSRHPGPGGQQR